MNATEKIAGRARFDALHQCANTLRLLSEEAKERGHSAKVCFLETVMGLVMDDMGRNFPAYTAGAADSGDCQP